MSEYPGPLEVEQSLLGIDVKDESDSEVSVTGEEAIIARRTEIRNNLRGFWERTFGLNKKSEVDIWLEEDDRIDEAAMAILRARVVSDLEEARKIAKEDRFCIPRLHLDFDERAKRVGGQLFGMISKRRVMDSIYHYWDERSKPDLVGVGEKYIDREAVRAVKNAVWELMIRGEFGCVREVIYRWLFLVDITAEELDRRGDCEDLMDGLKEAIIEDLAESMAVHPRIFVTKMDAIEELGLLSSGELVFKDRIRKAIASSLSRAKARNEEFYGMLRGYYQDNGLIGSDYPDVEPTDWEYERSFLELRTNYVVIWDEFLSDYPSFRKRVGED